MLSTRPTKPNSIEFAPRRSSAASAGSDLNASSYSSMAVSLSVHIDKSRRAVLGNGGSAASRLRRSAGSWTGCVTVDNPTDSIPFLRQPGDEEPNTDFENPLGREPYR